MNSNYSSLEAPETLRAPRLSPRPAVDRSELKRLILEKGCFEQEENERIFKKWFQDAPRYLFRAVDRKYRLTQMEICDVGCSYGMNLVHCTPGSYGIELEPKQVAFARSLDLSVWQRDIITDDLSDLPRVDAVWCAAVLEHVESPHTFLRKLQQLLKPEGLLALHVPTVPALRSLGLGRLPVLGKYFTGHVASDHINAFTPETLTFVCERAGYRTIEVSPFFPGPLRLFNHVPPFPNMIDGCTYIGRAVPDWQYPPKATRRVAATPKGFSRRQAEVSSK